MVKRQKHLPFPDTIYSHLHNFCRVTRRVSSKVNLFVGPWRLGRCLKRQTGPLASSKSEETGKNYRKWGAKAKKREYKETWLRPDQLNKIDE